jgi:hypothetical protein
MRPVPAFRSHAPFGGADADWSTKANRHLPMHLFCRQAIQTTLPFFEPSGDLRVDTMLGFMQHPGSSGRERPLAQMRLTQIMALWIGTVY